LPLLTLSSPNISYHALYSGVDPTHLVSVPSCSTVVSVSPSIPTHCTASESPRVGQCSEGTVHEPLTALNVPPVSM
jgi:hypothetical protein